MINDVKANAYNTYISPQAAAALCVTDTALVQPIGHGPSPQNNRPNSRTQPWSAIKWYLPL